MKRLLSLLAACCLFVAQAEATPIDTANTAIAATPWTNGVEAITGATMQGLLVDIMAAVSYVEGQFTGLGNSAALNVGTTAGTVAAGNDSRIVSAAHVYVPPGYQGDGGSHQLSTVTSFQGVNTTGYTLVQWQALLPAAIALTDEIDGAAINSAIQVATGPVTYSFPPGTARLSHPIVSCAYSVSLFGAGSTSTIFNFLASDAWDHCQTASPTATRIEAHDIQFNSLTTGAGLYGVKASFLPAENLLFTNVQVNGFNSCMLMTNAGGSGVERTFCYSGLASGSASVGNGIEWHGTNSFINHIRDTLVQNYNIGYRWESTNNSSQLGLEDQSLVNSAAGGVNKCIEITADYGGYSPLLYNINNFSCDAAGGFINAQAAAQLQIDGGDWLIDQPVGTWTGVGQDMFRFCRIVGGYLRNADISNNTVAVTVNSYVHFIGGGSTCGLPAGIGAANVLLENNIIEYKNANPQTALIVKDNLTGGIVSRGNRFTFFFVSQNNPPANAYSWSSFDVPSALYLGNPGEIVQANTALTSVTTAVPQTLATLALNQGLWSCHAQVALVPSSTASFFQGAFNTTSATIPAAPGNGFFQVNSAMAGTEVQTIGPYVIDFTAATTSTNFYVVATATFPGTAQMDTIAQCARLR